MNVESHLRLAGQNLLGCLSCDDNFLPYWHMVVDGQRNARYEFRPHCTGHNVGRWWNTMLRLERATEFEIPTDVEAAMLANSWRLADNNSGIFLEDVDPTEPSTWYIHSYRETMLSFGLLVSCRNSERARKSGLRAIDGMSRASRDMMEWCFSFGSGPELAKQGNSAAPAYSHGRAIEGLLCFYEASGEQAALDEAQRLADFHFDYLIDSDGNLSSDCGHHTHSYLNTVRGLLMLSALQHSRKRLEALRRTYDNAIADMITPSGFVTHDIGARYGGDIASAGDIAHIALSLWDCFGDASLLDDAERVVRARLLPAQACEPVPLQPMPGWSGDCVRDIASRFVGTIGGSVGHVRGQTCVTDFTAAALHSLLELWTRTVDIDDDAVRVNFHFDRVLEDVEVSCTRNPSEAKVTVNNRTGKPLRLRLPGWADKATSILTVNGEDVDLVVESGFIAISQTGVETNTQLVYRLPSRTIEEQSCDESETDDAVTFSWIGDEINDVSSGGPYMEPNPALCSAIL